MRGKARNGKRVLFCERGSAKEKGRSDLSKNLQKSDSKWGRARKKSTSQGKKRVRSLEKSPEIGFETGKSKKNGDFGAKKVGWGRGEKMGFTSDFAML